MGGFAFDTSVAPVPFLPEGRTRLTLRLGGLHYIAERAPSPIPDVSEEDIRDESKADGLPKVLVCLQAIWFCVQCVVRVAQSQDISFLELNTFAHAVCALLTYALWWHKSLDIEPASLLVGDEAREMCALMRVNSNGESEGNSRISQLVFRHLFSLYPENRYETELIRGQKYGDRVVARWTDIFNGRHLTRLRAHQCTPRAILRWDPVLEKASGGLIVWPQGPEPCCHSLSPEAIQIRKGDFFFGFCCHGVYTQADWYVAFPASRDWDRIDRNHRSRSLASYIGHEISYQRRVISKNGRDHRLVNQECTFEPSDLARRELVSRTWKKYRPTLRDYAPRTQDLDAPLYNGICERIGD